MNLDANGVVLTGAALEQYSKRKGLCHLCARFVTHKRAGKLFRRNQWEPLTMKSETTGEYLVYKGYCIQPTCYTLDQAKEALGEKSPTSRKSIRESNYGLLSFAPVGKGVHMSKVVPYTGPTTTARRTSDASGVVQRRRSNESDSSRPQNGGRRSPSGSVSSVNGSVTSTRYTMSNKWSRDLPLITLQSVASSQTGTATPSEAEIRVDPTPSVNALVGAVFELASDMDNSRLQREAAPSKELQETQSMATKSTLSAVSLSSRRSRNEDKRGGIFKRSMGLFHGRKKRSKYDDRMVDSFASSISSGSMTDDCSTSQESQLPGYGFVVGAAEGNYRDAFKTLDLADGQTSQAYSEPGEIKALCLQSKQLDDMDIELVAVEVDAMNRRWVSPEFLLEDDDDEVVSTWDYDHEHRVEQDLSAGIHAVHLSHVYCSGDEKLELEADLDDFEALERVRIEGKQDRTSSDFLVFRTRVLLEVEIRSCRETISDAAKSDAPADIQHGIEARSRMNMLLPLRKFYLSRRELEHKIGELSKAIAALKGDELDRRYYLATQKEQLVIQVEEEKREEDLQRMKAQAKEKSLRDDAAPNIDVSEQPAKDSVAAAIAATEPGIFGSPPACTLKTSVNVGSVAPLEGTLRTEDNQGRTVVNMTVFQSAPLAYVDRSTGTHHVCPLLDFEYEGRALTQALKDAEAAGTKVDVEFDIATTDRLSAFLAKGESRVMHLSCHGHPDYLALENGFGGMQILAVRDLKRFIASGAGNLEVVFVSACHSKAAGKAFLDAGIRHVICCRQDDKFRDEGAIEFARSFYRALALNNTVKQAFKMAREAMRISPMVKGSKAEYDKFILLPELPDNDPYHDVHIFSNTHALPVKRPLQSGRPEALKKRATRILPRVPQYFVGREMDMYTILDALRSNDVVSIQGPPEIGKTSLVAAISRYIEQRHKSFLFDDVFWLPVQEGSIPPDDRLCLDLSRIFEMIKRASAPCQSDRGYADCWGRVLRQLHDKRVLLVVHGRDLTSYASRASLEAFLRDLLKVSSAKVITVDVPVIEGAGPTTAIVEVKALDFDAAVLLFARHTRSSSASAPQIIKALMTLPCSNKEELEPSQAKLVAWRRRRIFDRIGAGVPAAIRRAALEMSDDDLVDLMRIAKRPLVEVDSRAELEAKLTELEAEERLELKHNNFLKARDIQEAIQELQCVRQDFPTVEELSMEVGEAELALQTAISDKHYDEASNLKRHLATLQDQISKELNSATTQTWLQRMSSF